MAVFSCVWGCDVNSFIPAKFQDVHFCHRQPEGLFGRTNDLFIVQTNQKFTNTNLMLQTSKLQKPQKLLWRFSQLMIS